MMNRYDVGDLVRVSGRLADADGEPLDPTNVFCKVKSPGGTVTTYSTEIVKDTTGEYHVDVDANAAGTWSYKFYSTGTGQAAKEYRFVVKDTEF